LAVSISRGREAAIDAVL